MKENSWGLSENSSYKIVALLITLILWIIILGSRESTLTKMVPADYLLPRDVMIVNNIPHEVAFRVTGPRLALKRFTEITEPLTVDLTSALEGLTTVRIHPDSINVPPGLRVLSVAPATITPNLERVISKTVRVEVVTQGELADSSLKLIRTEANPAMWVVFGARSVVEKLTYVKTAPINLAQVKRSISASVPLIIDEAGLMKQSDAKVSVNLVVK